MVLFRTATANEFHFSQVQPSEDTPSKRCTHKWNSEEGGTGKGMAALTGPRKVNSVGGASLRELFGRGCGGEICVSERGFPFVEVSFFYTSAFDMFLLFGFPSPKEPIGCFLFWLSLFRASLRKNCFTIFLYSFLSSCGVNISSIIYGIGF